METKNEINSVQPETKEAYVPPAIETVEVRVERGFECSSLGGDDPDGDGCGHSW